MQKLELESIRVRYGDVEALKGVSLSVAPAEFIAVLGPSGCGKTTLLRVLGGFVGYDGRVTVDGRAIDGIASHKRNIGIVFQDYALFPHMTLGENVAFGPRMHRVPAGEARARVAEAIGLLRLDGLEGRYPHELSGGQQQRVALARAIAIKPSVLLLDEPLGALDKKLREEMQVELRQLQKRVGITTLFVTHDQDEALALSDRIAVMNDGEIAQLGTPEEVYEQPRTRFVAEFIGRSNILQATVDDASGEHWRCRMPGGEPVTIAGDDGAGPGGAGSTVCFSIRPEKLRLIADPAELDGDNVLKGILEHVTYLGTVSQLRVRSDSGQAIDIDHPNRERSHGGAWRPGEPVQVAWRPGDAVIVADTG